MTSPPNPYDELPYRCFPIEFTAPERLALASMLHGGPRPRLDSYRVLELGCGNGGNLLPLAYYRQHASFVGVDGASSQIELARSRQSALNLPNIEFVAADFSGTAEQLSGQFDYIIAHGVFSWVPHNIRDHLLELCGQRLAPGGLLYLNYNTRPGWNIRGLVRDFLLARTANGTSLRARAELAQHVAAKVVSALTGLEHPYSRLLVNEFVFVAEGDMTWVGHEFLSADNHPYWRSEFLALAQAYDLEYVADADFNYGSGRIPEDLAPRLVIEEIAEDTNNDVVDLLCFRQLHSPILTKGSFSKRLPDLAEFGNLIVASCLERLPEDSPAGNPLFKHPTGYEVEAKEEYMRLALTRLRPLWPRGLRVAETLPNDEQVYDDLKLLHRHGLVELSCIGPQDFGIDGEALNKLERDWDGYFTTPDHRTSRIKS